MSIEWGIDTLPGYLQIQDGELVRLSTVLPAFDSENSNLHGLTPSQLIAAGWYIVSECPPPNTFGGDGPQADMVLLTMYALDAYDPETGLAQLIKTT